MRALSLLLLVLIAGPATADSAADGWITHPGRPAAPAVLEFARDVTLDRVPPRLVVDVTADSRFILRVNSRAPRGRGDAAGTGDGTLPRRGGPAARTCARRVICRGSSSGGGGATR